MAEPPATRGEQTRQEILAAAKRLFLSQGFTATPMRQIARAVGITPAAIYNHYPSKDQLFTALLRSVAPYEELFALFGKIEAGSAEELVRRAFRAALAFATDHQDYLQLALIDAQEREGAALVTLLPEVLPRAHRMYERLAALDASRSHDDARLRAVPFPVFLRALISLIAGFMLTEHVVGPDRVPGFDGIEWPEALVDVYLHGVLAPSERDAGGAVGP
jgi:AcrR family transcriptional regulator